MSNFILPKIKKRTQLIALLIFISLLFACTSHKPILLYEKTSASQNNIATLSMPIAIDVVYHNGNRTSYTPTYRSFVSYKILSGKHVLGFRYQDMVTDEDGNSESIKSRTVIIKFNAVAGAHYTINFTPPKTIEKALALEKALTLTLSHNDNVIASSYLAPQAPSISWFASEPFTPEMDELFNSDNENEAFVIEKPNKNAPASEHLNYWWSKASQSERQAFSSFIVK